ncbi:porin [Desulfuromonas versatilis]|uniref:Porin n=1 Tax=Desulfuromonas versatilis TaxID=2802975 RepID=A0ABN6DV54_9BACT|nr:OmpA family protein [Desulfuromonas versatilis]BCR04010.1 porin [Desulfuromonas versatilis]
MKQSIMLKWWYWALAGVLILQLGCAKKVENQALEQARAAYSSTQSDPEVHQYAPVALTEAKEALIRAEAAWVAGGEDEVIDHYAYLARQRTALAQEVSDLHKAEAVVEKAASTRTQVLLSAREAEAQSAIQRAEEARRQAEERARAMEEAQARARQLEAELSELQAKPTQRGMVLTLGDILFDVNKAVLNPGGLRTVEKLADFLKEYPERRVMVEGFTDSTGSEDYNLQLSQRRAEAVKYALLDEGISLERIQARGFGESYPIANNESVAGRQQNRRVEVIISDEAGQIPERVQ